MSLSVINIKIVFHAFAIAAGIVAGACGLLSSNNRITLFVTFALIAGIFELAIPFLKFPPIKTPELNYSIKLLPSNYAEGYNFDGIKWGRDYEEYRLYFCNKNKNIDIHDLRISVDMLGGIVQYKILTQEGCENLSVLLSDMIGGGIGNRDKIISPVKVYSNNLKINAIRVFREGYFEVRLIVKAFLLRDDSEGVFEIRYRYADVDNNMIQESFAYKILVEDKNKKTLYIDIENFLKGNYLRSSGVIFDKPLVFKKGSVSIKGQSIEEPESIKFSLGDLKFAEEEFKKFKLFLGKSIIDAAKENKPVTKDAVIPLPLVKIQTKHLDREYSCFDDIQFKVRQIKDGFIYLDNKDQDRTIVIELIFNPETKDGEFSPDFVKVNRNSKNYNIDHEIAFYEFKKNLIGNAKLVFIDLDNNSVISETHNFVPVNIDPGGSLENMDVAITFLHKIKRIEDRFNLQLKIPEKFSTQNIKNIEVITAALSGTELKFGGSTFKFIASYDEAINMAKNLSVKEGSRVLFNNYRIELFNKNIELGKLQIILPPCRIFPTLEQLELTKDKGEPIKVVLKAIEADSCFVGHCLDYVDKE
jgi:hypothetical protein